jgi:hypothetical protein
MVKLSEIAQFEQRGSRTNTTFLGTETAKNTAVLKRKARVVSHEMQPAYQLNSVSQTNGKPN